MQTVGGQGSGTVGAAGGKERGCRMHRFGARSGMNGRGKRGVIAVWSRWENLSLVHSLSPGTGNQGWTTRAAVFTERETLQEGKSGALRAVIFCPHICTHSKMRQVE